MARCATARSGWAGAAARLDPDPSGAGCGAAPLSLAAWQQRLAASSHHLLYLLMLVLPLSGYLASNFSKHGVKFFNLLALPPWGSDDKAIYAVFNQSHKISVVLLLALVALHLLAALWHGLRRDGIFSRISLRPY